MGVLPSGDGSTVVTGFTGSARVPTIHVDHMEVGELLLGPSVLPILSDVFGGAQGVLGIEGLTGMRVYADFGRDRSEEHTSELQSRVDLVCRLLLEKKKKQINKVNNEINDQNKEI